MPALKVNSLPLIRPREIRRGLPNASRCAAVTSASRRWVTPLANGLTMSTRATRSSSRVGGLRVTSRPALEHEHRLRARLELGQPAVADDGRGPGGKAREGRVVRTRDLEL